MEIRTATAGDEHQIVTLINDLIIELGGPALPVETAVSTVHSFVAGGVGGAIIVASEDGRLAAVCTLTYQSSIRTLGNSGV